MLLSKQVCTPEQGKRLVELGIETESLFWHSEGEISRVPLDFNTPAFSVAELGEMLSLYQSEWTTIKRDGWDFAFKEEYGLRLKLNEKTEAEVRAEKLIYLLEELHLSPDTINLHTGASF